MLENIKAHMNAARQAELDRKALDAQLEEMAEQEYMHHLFGSDVTFFSQHYKPVIHAEALMVLTAPSGQGKSSWGIQSAVHAINQGMKVLFFSNEMNRVVLKRRILKATQANIEYAKNLIVVDRNVAPELKMYDKCADYIIDAAEKARPDLVIFDQINNATEASDLSDKTPDFKRAEVPLARLGDYVNEVVTRNYPARFIVMQQSLPPDFRTKPEFWNIFSLLRGAKNTYTHATHVVYVAKHHQKDGTINTILVTDKVRMPGYTYSRVSYWEMDVTGVFVPAKSPVDEEEK